MKMLVENRKWISLTVFCGYILVVLCLIIYRVNFYYDER